MQGLSYAAGLFGLGPAHEQVLELVLGEVVVRAGCECEL